MPRTPSGERKTYEIRQKRPNGDVYIIKREVVYDPEQKKNTVLSSELIGKIPVGESKVVSTRPKKDPDSEQTSELKAKRKHVGAMQILDHIGKVSGIDKAIYRATDKGTAQKIISIARYLVMTNGDSLPGIEAFQFMHPLPYTEGISEDVYHDLFVEVGRDESLIQSFFMSRCKGLSKNAGLAYDSTTIGTYSTQLEEACRNPSAKQNEGLDVYKFIVLYSVETRQPVAFAKARGTVSDVVTIKNALDQLTALGLTHVEIITDNGYYSQENIADMLLARFKFLTLAQSDIQWIRPLINEHAAELREPRTVCEEDVQYHGVVVVVVHDFKRPRRYASKEKGLERGDVEKIHRRVYVTILFNEMERVRSDQKFYEELFAVKELLDRGTLPQELGKEQFDLAEKFLIVKPRRNGLRVTLNEENIQEHQRYKGYMILVSNVKRESPGRNLAIYRRRATIESFFGTWKSKADGRRPRVWEKDTLMGRMFVQFVALCYYEYLYQALRHMKETLGQQIYDDQGNPLLSKTDITAEKKLLSWLNHKSLHEILQWFDVLDTREVSSSIRKKRWGSAMIARDKLFLNKLGMT